MDTKSIGAWVVAHGALITTVVVAVGGGLAGQLSWTAVAAAVCAALSRGLQSAKAS